MCRSFVYNHRDRFEATHGNVKLFRFLAKEEGRRLSDEGTIMRVGGGWAAAPE